MKGKIGTACQLVYLLPKVSKKFIKVKYLSVASEKAIARYRIIEMYENKEITAKEIEEKYEISESTFYRWLKRYRESGRKIQALEDRSRRPKRVRAREKRTAEMIRLVLEIRKKNPGMGKEKIAYILKRDYGKEISASSVGRILKEYRRYLPVEYNIKERNWGKKRKEREKKVRIKDIKEKLREEISELIQADTLEAMISGKQWHIFVGIDVKSKIMYMKGYRSKSSHNGADFLKRLYLIHKGEIRYVQVDNGSEFKKEFSKECERLGIVKVVNYAKKPIMNKYVERVIETIEKEYSHLLAMVEDEEDMDNICLEIMKRYNFYRPHQSLGYKTPIEYYLEEKYNIKNNSSYSHMYWTSTQI